MNNKPKKMYFVYGKDENNNIVVKEIVSVFADKSVSKENWDTEKHMPIINEFFKENGIEANGVDAIKEAEEKNIFARFDENELTDEKVNSFLGPELAPSKYDLPDDMIYEGEPEEELEEDNKTGKRVAAGVLAGLTALGIGAAIHENLKEDKEKDGLYDGMTDEQKEFFEDTFEAMKEFNEKATKDGNFKLAEDKTELHLTVEEAVALRIIMNNYSADDLIKIFGTTSFDTATVMENARSAYSKLSTYYMNAQEPSGLSRLINDDEAREFFERHEYTVTEFNINPTTVLSDMVIKNVYYDYINGGTNALYAEIDNPGVAWFTTTTVHGFELANRNMPEFLKVNAVSDSEKAEHQDSVIEVGMSLSKVTTSELLAGINEEIPLDILDAVDAKSLCAQVTSQTNEKLLALQTAITVVKTTSSPDVVAKLEKTEKFIAEKMEKAQKQFGKTVDTDIAQLVNNRFRTSEKEKEDKKDKYDISREDFDKMSKDEQDKYIKENGEVIKQTTTTTEQKVDESELTPNEKEQVEDKKKQSELVDSFENKVKVESATDASNYMNEKGAYNYGKEIVNPYNGEKVNTANLSLFNIVAHATAFGNGASEINSSDTQIQSRMNKDAAKVDKLIEKASAETKQALENKYGSDWKKEIKELYKNGYLTSVDNMLSTARKQGAELKQSAKDAYEKSQAKEEIKEQSKPTEESKQEKTEEIVPITPEVKPEINPLPYDPMTDPNYKQEGEIPYQGSSVGISDEQWDVVYEAPVKAK